MRKGRLLQALVDALVHVVANVFDVIQLLHHLLEALFVFHASLGES